MYDRHAYYRFIQASSSSHILFRDVEHSGIPSNWRSDSAMEFRLIPVPEFGRYSVYLVIGAERECRELVGTDSGMCNIAE
ncbi:hypothetical protein I4U23_017332 [Adineta vaga]|nr:hypothetical protein I4U23_017332 [Adineta vaga]